MKINGCLAPIHRTTDDAEAGQLLEGDARGRREYRERQTSQASDDLGGVRLGSKRNYRVEVVITAFRNPQMVFETEKGVKSLSRITDVQDVAESLLEASRKGLLVGGLTLAGKAANSATTGMIINSFLSVVEVAQGNSSGWYLLFIKHANPEPE